MAAGGRAKPAIGPGHDPEGRARWEDLRDEARTARARLARGELVESNAGADKCGAWASTLSKATVVFGQLTVRRGAGYLAQRNPPATGWTRHWSVLYTAQKRLDFYAHAEDVASHQRIDRVDLTGACAQGQRGPVSLTPISDPLAGARAEAVGSGKTTRPNCFMLRVATVSGAPGRPPCRGVSAGSLRIPTPCPGPGPAILGSAPFPSHGRRRGTATQRCLRG